VAWILTLTAVSDLDRVATEGSLRFGFKQSERYEREMVSMLDNLAVMPEIGSERQAASSVVRLIPCGSHNICYVVKDGDVLILRVLHGLQNWFDLL
jgi:toxin ParE1/3/4